MLSGVTSKKGASSAIAALLINPSMSGKASTADLAASQSPKSTHTGVIDGSSWIRLSKCFLVRESAKTFAPHATSCLAIALPIPEIKLRVFSFDLNCTYPVRHP